MDCLRINALTDFKASLAWFEDSRNYLNVDLLFDTVNYKCCLRFAIDIK